MGYKDLWMLKSVPDERDHDRRLAGQTATG
jgi:hypothetical protein